MSDTAANARPGWEQYSLAFLSVALTFVLLVVPMFEATAAERFLLHAGLTVVLVVAAGVARQRRVFRMLALLVAAIAVATGWLTLLVNHPILFVGSCLLESAFFAAMAVLILVAVLRKHMASVQSIFGAVNAYLLIGLAWSMLYLALESIDGESLSIANRATMGQSRVLDGEAADITALSQLIYFSFVTMSTLGYGDIVPSTPMARALTWMQSVLGQFYIAVLVAWLVSEIPRRRTSDGS